MRTSAAQILDATSHRSPVAGKGNRSIVHVGDRSRFPGRYVVDKALQMPLPQPPPDPVQAGPVIGPGREHHDPEPVILKDIEEGFGTGDGRFIDRYGSLPPLRVRVEHSVEVHGDSPSQSVEERRQMVGARPPVVEIDNNTGFDVARAVAPDRLEEEAPSSLRPPGAGIAVAI
jgi:hypothetical protein